MGHNPIPPAPAPTRESFHLGMARAAYVNGDLTLDEFEQSVEFVLRGGHLTQEARIPETPVFPPSVDGEQWVTPRLTGDTGP